MARTIASQSNDNYGSNERLSSSSSSSTPPPPPIPPIPNPVASCESNDDSTYLINYYCDTPINDLVDPIEYEQYLITNYKRITNNLRPVLLFPNDDVTVEKYQPPLRTLEPSVPELNTVLTSEDPYIQCVGLVNCKSLIVKKNNEKFLSESLNSKRINQAKELKRQEYEIDFLFSQSMYDDDYNCYSDFNSVIVLYLLNF